jgi:hypothetical protein
MHVLHALPWMGQMGCWFSSGVLFSALCAAVLLE